jgi:hypothetical protein
MFGKKKSYYYVFAYVVTKRHGKLKFNQKLLSNSTVDSVLIKSNEIMSIDKILDIVEDYEVPKIYQKQYMIKPLNDGERLKTKEIETYLYRYRDSFIDLTQK